MAELTEYSLVVLVSALFVAGSVATYNTFGGYESDLRTRADFVAVAAMASRAIENGTSGGTVTTGTSSVSCQDGTLHFASGTLQLSSSLPARCSFDVSLSPGPHVFRFSMEQSGLVLRVD